MDRTYGLTMLCVRAWNLPLRMIFGFGEIWMNLGIDISYWCRACMIFNRTWLFQTFIFNFHLFYWSIYFYFSQFKLTKWCNGEGSIQGIHCLFHLIWSIKNIWHNCSIELFIVMSVFINYVSVFRLW